MGQITNPLQLFLQLLDELSIFSFQQEMTCVCVCDKIKLQENG